MKKTNLIFGFLPPRLSTRELLVNILCSLPSKQTLQEIEERVEIALLAYNLQDKFKGCLSEIVRRRVSIEQVQQAVFGYNESLLTLQQKEQQARTQFYQETVSSNKKSKQVLIELLFPSLASARIPNFGVDSQSGWVERIANEALKLPRITDKDLSSWHEIKACDNVEDDDFSIVENAASPNAPFTMKELTNKVQALAEKNKQLQEQLAKSSKEISKYKSAATPSSSVQPSTPVAAASSNNEKKLERENDILQLNVMNLNAEVAKLKQALEEAEKKPALPVKPSTPVSSVSKDEYNSVKAELEATKKENNALQAEKKSIAESLQNLLEKNKLDNAHEADVEDLKRNYESQIESLKQQISDLKSAKSSSTPPPEVPVSKPTPPEKPAPPVKPAVKPESPIQDSPKPSPFNKPAPPEKPVEKPTPIKPAAKPAEEPQAEKPNPFKAGLKPAAEKPAEKPSPPAAEEKPNPFKVGANKPVIPPAKPAEEPKKPAFQLPAKPAVPISKPPPKPDEKPADHESATPAKKDGEDFPFFNPQASGSKFYPYEKLTETDANKRFWKENNIDSSCREKYLSDEEFQKVFSMSKAAYEELKPFKKREVKLKAKLF